jgi:hypothetical protein
MRRGGELCRTPSSLAHVSAVQHAKKPSPNEMSAVSSVADDVSGRRSVPQKAA